MSTAPTGVPNEEELRRYEHQAAQAEAEFAAAEQELRARYNRAAEDGVEERAEALQVRLADLKHRGLSDPEGRNLEALLHAVPGQEAAATEARWQALQARQAALQTRQKALDAYGLALTALEKRRQERVFRISEAAQAFERVEGQMQSRLDDQRRAAESQARAAAEAQARAEAEARMKAEAQARAEAAARARAAREADVARLESERTLTGARPIAAAMADPAPAPVVAALGRITPVPAQAAALGRKLERVSLDADVGWESDNNFFTGWTENISEGGIFIATWQLKPRGTRVQISFTLPGGRKITGEGEVAWTREMNPYDDTQLPGLGVRFLSLDGDALSAIQEYVARRAPIFMVS